MLGKGQLPQHLQAGAGVVLAGEQAGGCRREGEDQRVEPLGRVAVAPHRAQEQAFSGQHPDVFLFKIGHHEPPQGNVLHAAPYHGHEYGVTAFKADGLPGQLVGGQGAAGTQRAAGACQQMAFGVEQGQAVDGVAHRFQQHLQAIRLGGGSASIITGSDLDHLLRLIRSCYHVAEDAPVTMRTCPADINGANMPFYNRSHFTRYDLELYSLEPLDFCTLDTLNYSEQMPYITHGFLRADRRDSMGFVLLYGKKTVSRWGFRHSVLEVTRRPVCHLLLQRCAGADMLDDAAAQAQLDEAAQLLTEAGFVQYLPRRWAKPGCEDKFWQGAANGMDVLAFGLSAYTRLDGMITTNTSDLNTYLAHSADYEQITVSTVPVQTAE